jgi:octaprenyl-diphosphate synthase
MTAGSWDLGVSKELEMVEKRMRELVDSPQMELTDVALHVIGAGGKRVRPTLAILSHHALHGNDMSKLIDIAAAMELIHSATLVHDDINDGADFRRGKKAAYKQFGLHEAIVAGDFLFARAFYVGGLFSKKIVEVVATSTTRLAEGEMMQFKHKWDSGLSVDQYLKIIEGKTAHPIKSAAEIGASLAEGKPEDVQALGEYGLNLGIAFQIVDDVLDVSGDERSLGKPIGTDLREGNLTLPLILARDEDKAAAKQIREVFAAGKVTEEQVAETLEMVRGTGAIEKSLEIAREYATGATEYLDRLPASVHRSRLIDLSRLVVDRTN